MSEPTNRWRWGLILGMTILGMLLTLSAARHGSGWPAAARLTFIQVAIYLVAAGWRRDTLLLRLAVFGIVAGFGELAADAYSVSLVGTLVYPAEPRLWASPFYMPFSWMVVLGPLGFVAWFLAKRMGRGWATLIMALVGASYVPSYEYLARGAGFWTYHNCRMILGVVPIYVIAAEAMIIGVLPWLVTDMEDLSARHILGRAGLEILVMLLGTILAFQLVG